MLGHSNLAWTACSYQEREQLMAIDTIVEVTDTNFDQLVLKSDQPVLIDFWGSFRRPELLPRTSVPRSNGPS